MPTHVAVIGGGPAGLAAAATIAEATAARVTLIDEGARPGGRLTGQLHRHGETWVVGAHAAERLVDRARRAGVEILSGRQVWACEPGWRVSLDDGRQLLASYVVVATGAAEHPLPMPGWTLPGVLAVGAAQNLLHAHRVLPGERVAVVGTDPLALAVADEIVLAGGTVVGVFRPSGAAGQAAESHPVDVLQSLARLSAVAPAPWMRVGARLLRARTTARVVARGFPRSGIRAGGVPLRLRHGVESIEGDAAVEAITVRAADGSGRPVGRPERVEVDAVCLSGGLYPVQDLTTRCDLVTVPEVGGRVPLTGGDLRTTAPGMYVAGSVTGIEGATVAEAQGGLAGTAVALELEDRPDRDGRLRSARAQVERARAESAFSFLPDVCSGRHQIEELWEHRVAS